MSKLGAPSAALPDVRRVQRRTLTLLFCTQVIGGIGVAVGIAVGALLAADLGGTGLSGLASSAAVVGAALIALPATRLMRTGGRRPGLVFAYVLGVVGALVVVTGSAGGSIALMLLGMFLFGGGTAANLQARYTAVDLAEPAVRGRQLSLIVWATTVGAVAGPSAAPLADSAVSDWNLREYSGPFVFSAIAFGTAAVAILLFLRPDPLLTARAVGDASGEPEAARGGWRAGWQAVRASQPARLGLTSVAVGHLVMVAVMSMTPVHIDDGLTDHGAVLRVVGIVLSAHIAGMYAFAPVMGLLTDRLGRRAVILIGIGILLLACGLAAVAGHGTWLLSTALFLLGLGWSALMVSGSTLLSESVDAAVRPAAQGLNDLIMGLAGASAGAVSGFVVFLGGYPVLAILAAVTTLPLLALAFRPVGPDRAPDKV